MRFIAFLTFVVLFSSCGGGDHVNGDNDSPVIDTNCRVPAIADGVLLDSTGTELVVSWITSSDTAVPGKVHVVYDPEAESKMLNVYADSAIPTILIDSIINGYWNGEDVRLAGVNNGMVLGIPFHALRRFPPPDKPHATLPEQYFNLRIYAEHCTVNDWPYHYTSPDQFFGPFYSDAFSPFDSSSKYPSRAWQRIDGLMMEGNAWDGIEFRQGPDSAQVLAAYNEFVNKLEIFEKAGPFWTLRFAMIDVTYDESVSWSRFMNVASLHYHWLATKRDAAKQYLADYVANNGSAASKEFTEEDLHLLYPDRLRWNGFISGELENRYDADMLTDWQ